MSAVLSGRRGRVLFAVSTALAVGLTACNSDPTGPEVIEEVTFASSLNVDLSAMTKLPEGMYIQDRVVGTGPGLTTGDRAWVYYELRLRTGTPIGNGEFGFDFPLGGIEGWDLGLAGMMAGSHRLLVIPSALGYGNQPYQAIPGGSILVFEVELDSIT